jgi:HEAT repeat protein
LGAYYKSTGDSAAALEALTSPFDGHDPDDNWYVVRKMGYLADLGARDAVVALHAKLDDDAYYDRAAAAAALRAVGELELAGSVLEGDTGSVYGTADDRSDS